jgi:transcriptional regulator of NAD metabolism
LNGAESSVTGSELSSLLGVSRQAIVNDIAILRASGQSIIGGPHGYRVGRVSGLINEAGEAPLSVITGGRHTHTVRAPNLDALDAAKRELRERGILDEPANAAARSVRRP